MRTLRFALVADVDGDGPINYEEFILLMMDCDGQINSEEFVLMKFRWLRKVRCTCEMFPCNQSAKPKNQ
jgi:hypothetical protein